MFIGEFLCMIVFKLSAWRNSSRVSGRGVLGCALSSGVDGRSHGDVQGKADEEVKFSPLIFLPPAMCDCAVRCEVGLGGVAPQPLQLTPLCRPRR